MPPPSAGAPEVPVDAAGFLRHRESGNWPGEAMFKYVVGTREPARPAAGPTGGRPGTST